MTAAIRRPSAASAADLFGGRLPANILCHGHLALVTNTHPDVGPLVAFGFCARKTGSKEPVKLRPGDLVIVYADAAARQVLWQGEFTYRKLPPPRRRSPVRPRVKMPDGSSTRLWFDRTQAGVNPERWLSWFSQRCRATVIRPQR